MTIENVKFSIGGTAYDPSSMGNTFNTNPDASGIPGCLAFAGSGREGDLRTMHERERGSQYRLFVRPLSVALDATIRAGAFIIVTEYKDETTNIWVPLSPAVQFKIDFVDRAHLGTRERMLSLSTLGKGI